ncbi:MAG: divergent polysaccharide deacetylase family protein, partial [Pseudomonadota bacterium]
TAVPRVSMSLNSFRDATPAPGEDKALDNAAPVSDEDNDTAGKKPVQSAAQQVAAAGLHPHPDLSLIEKSDLGPLPVIGKDGRAPWRVYARPFSRLDSRPRIAVIVSTLGVSSNATQSAIDMLPGEVTFSFAPFTKDLDRWVDRSRAAGHEVLIDLPMEPLDYPQSDPGPHTLLASVPIDQNLRHLGWILSRTTGYVGVSVYMGSNIANKPRALNPILSEIKSRGLMLVDTRENPLGVTGKVAGDIGLAVAASDLVIDGTLSAKHIDGQLAALERSAKENGAAVAVARPYPITLKRLKEWSGTLAEKGIALAPVSAMPEAR